jgi:RNA polymerase primary sigma factor
MAGKTKATPRKDDVGSDKDSPETSPDSPLLDLSGAAVKKLIRTVGKRGYVTHEQINALSKELSSEQIEDVLAMFSETGVNVVGGATLARTPATLAAPAGCHPVQA